MDWVLRRSRCGCSGERRDGGSQELASGGDPKPCGLGRELPSPAPSPAFSEPPGPLATAGGHPGDGRAVLRPLGAPGHRDHQQQRAHRVQRAPAPAPGGRRLPRQDGRQVRSRGRSHSGFTQFHGPSRSVQKMGSWGCCLGPHPCLLGDRKMGVVTALASGGATQLLSHPGPD